MSINKDHLDRLLNQAKAGVLNLTNIQAQLSRDYNEKYARIQSDLDMQSTACATIQDILDELFPPEVQETPIYTSPELAVVT